MIKVDIFIILIIPTVDRLNELSAIASSDVFQCSTTILSMKEIRSFKKPRIPSFSKRLLLSKMSSSKENENPDRQVLIFRAIIFMMLILPWKYSFKSYYINLTG